MEIKTEYTIWMIPTGYAYARLISIIEELSRKFGTLRFEPHVTLLGEILLPKKEVLDKTRRLTELISSFEISLFDIGHSNQYFKCLFLNAEKSPDLMEAGRKARRVFGRDEPYEPHLSLLYGNIDDDVKKEIEEELNVEYKNLRFGVHALHLFSAPRDSEWPSSVRFTSIAEFGLK